MDWRLDSAVYEGERASMSLSAPSSYASELCLSRPHGLEQLLEMPSLSEHGTRNTHARDYAYEDFQFGIERSCSLGFSNNGRSGLPHTESTGALSGSMHQNTRHARRLYFGGIPPNYADEELLKMFLNNVISRGLSEENDFSYVVSVYINHKKSFAFVELKSIELTTACLELDGVVYRNSVLKVQRANEYKPEAVNGFRNAIKLSLPAEVFSGATAIPAAAVQESEPHLASFIQQGSMASIERGAIVLLGFPFDEGARRQPLGRPGGANGPKIIRRFINRMGAASLSNPEFGVDMGALQLVDIGDIPVGLTLDEAHARLALIVAEVIHRGGTPFVIGGSNDMSYFSAAGLMAVAGGAVGVLNVSSQLHVKPANADNKIHAGSAFRLLLEDTRFCPPRNGLSSMPSCDGKLLNFGCQGSQCSAEQARYVADRNARTVWLGKDIRAARVDAAEPVLGCSTAAARVFRRALEELGDAAEGRARRPLMVALSVEALSSAACPGAANASSLGLSAEEALEMLFQAGADPGVALVDLSEFNPDVEEPRSARLAADLFYWYCMGVASRTPSSKPLFGQQQQQQQQQRRLSGSQADLLQQVPFGGMSPSSSHADALDLGGSFLGGHSLSSHGHSSHGFAQSSPPLSSALAMQSKLLHNHSFMLASARLGGRAGAVSLEEADSMLRSGDGAGEPLHLNASAANGYW